jgi:hypothetical protein
MRPHWRSDHSDMIGGKFFFHRDGRRRSLSHKHSCSRHASLGHYVGHKYTHDNECTIAVSTLLISLPACGVGTRNKTRLFQAPHTMTTQQAHTQKKNTHSMPSQLVTTSVSPTRSCPSTRPGASHLSTSLGDVGLLRSYTETPACFDVRKPGTCMRHKRASQCKVAV